MLRRIYIGLFSFILAFQASAFVDKSTPSEFQEKLTHLVLTGNEQILQYGGSLGDTKALAALLPTGKVVLAADQFKVRDANNVSSGQLFDYILIEEALTKEYKQQQILESLLSKLKPYGKLVLHLPDYKQGVMARVLIDTWMELEGFIQDSPKFLTYNGKQYQKMLTHSGLKVAKENRYTDIKEFENAHALKTWLSENWVYSQDMSESDKELFLSVFVDKYLTASHQNEGLPVRWEQCYLSIEANKAA